jgi:predicted DNA-binding protein YlxM (UPF0122 family)
MTKINKQNNNAKEIALTESKTLRNEAVASANVDFLDKIKAVQYLTEDMILSVEQIANYYEVSKNSVNTIIQRNRDEFEEDGMKILVGDELKDFKSIINAHSNESALIGSKVNSFTILTKRSLLRVGLIMTNCAMATRIRNYLLNLEEIATEEQKAWAIQREAGKIERKRMCTAISKYLPDSPHKKFQYPTYTNMLYRILFGKDAKLLRIERNKKDNDLLRDSFTGEELKLVEEGETIITA